MLYSSKVRSSYPKLVSFVAGEMSQIPFKKPRVWRAFLKYSELSAREAMSVLTQCRQPTLDSMEMPGSNGRFKGATHPNTVFLAEAVAQRFERDHALEKAKTLVESTILHELVHWGDWKDGEDQEGEEGKAFEREAYGKDISRYW